MTGISATTVEPIATGTDRYMIDGRSSRFTVSAFATGLMAAMGHNPTIGIRDFDGEIEFDADKLEADSLKIIIMSSSLSVQDDISAKDLREMERLMNQEVLETAKFPEILYESVEYLCLEDRRYALFGHVEGELDVARRHAQSADQRTSRVIREYAACVRRFLIRPDRLRPKTGFGCGRRTEVEGRA